MKTKYVLTYKMAEQCDQIYDYRFLHDNSHAEGSDPSSKDENTTEICLGYSLFIVEDPGKLLRASNVDSTH